MIFSDFAIMLASFVSPVEIGTTPGSLLLAIPLIAVIAVVYKATKLEKIELRSFVRESAILFGSIAVFMALTAVGFYLILKLSIG